VYVSVVDRHSFEKNTFDADPDPDRHHNNADPHAAPTPSFTHVEKYINFMYF
jgi:hypothetical protein